MSKRPQFSIIIPTRNRADLLPFAITSVLNQTFKDFEIIVSDNHSSDNTFSAVNNFDDERIKYFRSETPLSLGESWEFAVTHATGHYLAFLADDDAYSTIYLETMQRVIDAENAEIVSCKLVHYYSAERFFLGRRIPAGSLAVQPFTRSVTVLDRDQAVATLLAHVRLTFPLSTPTPGIFPQLVNSVYRRSLFDRVYARLPKIFPIVGADIYSSALFLNIAEKYCCIDEPHYLHCQWGGSSTSGDQSMFEKYPEESCFDYVPLKKTLSSQNYCTNAVLRAIADWPEVYEVEPFDWTYYLISSYRELKSWETDKIDVREQLKEFQTVLESEPNEIRDAVKAAINDERTLIQSLRAKLRDPRLVNFFARFKHRNITVIDGFSNIAECAKVIDKSFLNLYGKK